MTKDEATLQATKIAKEQKITMLVTFSPYEETLDESDKYGYLPEGATEIFVHDKIVATIHP